MEHGIFGDERVMQFLITVKAIAEQCFQQLHTISHENHAAVDVANDSFKVGLHYIEQWNDSIVEQEATAAISKYPDIVGGYKHALMQYVKHVHRDKRASPDAVVHVGALVRVEVAHDMPSKPQMIIQNVAPGPPTAIATATPAMFPSPTVPETAVASAWK